MLSRKDENMSLLNLTAKNFDETIASGKFLIDFWAGWCMPCRMVAPIIDELAAEFEGRVTVAKVDIDNESSLAARYDIMSIPTVVLFNNGLEVKRFVGVQPKNVYEKELAADS